MGEDEESDVEVYEASHFGYTLEFDPDVWETVAC